MRPEQHKRDMAREPLASPTLCAACHTQFMDKDMNNWNWVKMQDDYGAWLQSPYSQRHQQEFSNASATRCQDCHMERVAAIDPSADAKGQVRVHDFPGANTMLALLAGDAVQLERTLRFLQNDRVRVDVSAQWEAGGREAAATVVVTNVSIGHNFPGGTLDINEAWVSLSVADRAGNIVYESGKLLESGDVDPAAHFYRTLPIDRSGNLVWRHDLFNMVGEAYKDFVPAGESDVLVYRFPIPDGSQYPLQVEAKVNYRKLNDRYARWALKEQYQAIPIVEMAAAQADLTAPTDSISPP
jgi:hypothetical protein